MSTEPPANENGTTSSVQRVAIAIGTLIIVLLTVVAAIFLAMQDLPGQETPVAVEISPTPTKTSATATATASPTESPLPPVDDTPSDTPTVTTDTPPPASPTTAPPTDTPLPLPPTFTPTPFEVIVTATPLPQPPTSAAPEGTGGVCQPPPSWVAYSVQPGDTLERLATRTDATVFDLQQVNCLETLNLRVGQTIFLPFVPPTPTVTWTPSPTGLPGPTPTRTPTPIIPQIDNVVPNRVDRDTAANEEVIITVVGRNFKPNRLGFKVELRGPASIQLELGEAYSSTSFDAIVPAGLAEEGTYSLVVTNPDGGAGIRQSAYTVGPPTPTDTPAPAPDIIRFTPTSGSIGDEITLTVQGRNFRPNQSGFKAELQSISSSFRIELDLGETRTDTNFTAIIRAGSLDRGDYNLVVTNPDGRSDIAATLYRAIE